MFSPENSTRLSHKPIGSPPQNRPPYRRPQNSFEPNLIKRYIDDPVYVWMLHGNSFWICPVTLLGDILFCYAWDGCDWKFIQFNIHGIDCFYQEEAGYAG